MKLTSLAFLGAFAATLAGCASTPHSPEQSTSLMPPIADRRPYTVESPQGDRIDPYYWLRDDSREDPEMLAHLEAENAYTEAKLAPYSELRETLYQEIVGRLKSDDASPPTYENGYWYYSRFEPGRDYAIMARRKGSMDAPEEILIDQNQRAESADFYALGTYVISPDNRLMAVAEDTVGRRQYVLRVKNLETGEWLDDAVENINANLVWTDGNQSVLYVEKDPTTLLGKRVREHVLGSTGEDKLIYEEPDDSYYMGIGRGKSNEFLYIGLYSTQQTEYRYARADDPTLTFRPVLPREDDHEYEVADHDGRFIILTNWQAKNFRLMSVAPETSADKSTWKELIPTSDTVLIESFEVFKDYLAVNERRDGLRKIRVMPWDGGEAVTIDASEPTYAASLIGSAEYDWPWMRYDIDTLTTPTTTIDYNMATGEKRVLKVQPVEGDFDPDAYTSEYIRATARDGTEVPVSIVYRKNLRQPGKNPLLVYGYGSYGHSLTPYLSVSRLSLLDRGFVFAMAHIRGGQEMGRHWYEDGKLGNKMNTFTDFIDVTEHLVEAGYGAKDKVFAAGGSAGGLLVGAVANMRPDLYRGIIADVPFVDVVTTMLDESIPLTTNEFDEWGNPKHQPHYDTMLAYSPYDNVAEQDYPAMLVTGGLWDSQVQYFEPAKWVARLRHRKTDDNWLLLHMNMDAGHGGKSGRYRKFEEVALEYTFMLSQLGISTPDALAVDP
ncbi:S9 family peptidase [uncultured Abyssibacter sp.]|uniref:S9 family peptidase n=1 Tax=uncultured Abyssibacter sp. TaxID=2320202 RepID=UPI0032B16975